MRGHLASGGLGTRQRRENSNASLTSSGSHATRWGSRRQSREQTGRRSIGNLFPLTGAGTAKHMMHLATQISNKVNQLYTSRADRERAEAEEQERKMQQAEEGDGSASGEVAALIEAVEEAEEKESSESSHSSIEEEEGPEEYDSELEDYDHEAAGERIAFMLEGLKCQDRTDCLDSLSSFYQSKMEGMNDNQEELQKLEADYHAREEETKDSLVSMVKAFESKGMTEVQVLVKCSATLQAGANGTFRQRQRQKFSKAAKKKALQDKAKSRELEEAEKSEKAEKNEKGEKIEDTQTQELTPKPKRKLKPLFEDEVKPEEEPEEEEDEELAMVSVRSEDLKDQDIWDLNRARELWNKMNEKTAKVSGGRGPAIEILQAMVVVQEGNAELLRRAEMAKKATATLVNTIDFLAKNVQAGIVIDFDNPPEEDEALVLSARQLKERLLQEIDLDELEEGLDPEELEEECQDLERILQEQERDIEALYKQREEKAAAQEAQNNSKLEKVLDDDEGVPSPKDSPKAKKSVFMDGRLEGIKIQGQGDEGGVSMREKMKQMAKTAAAISSIKRTAGPAANAKVSSAEDFKDDPKVKMLREHIATKDAQLEQGQRLLRRMRYERKLLRYCQKKAKAGFDDIVAEFAPPSLENFVDDGEVSDDEKEVKEEPKPEKPEKPDVPEEDQASSAASEAVEEEAQTKPAAKAKSKAEEAPKAPVPGVAKKILEKSAESGEGREAESELKKEVDRLQEELTTQANNLKEEKSKQKALRKEIKDLRKEFHTLADRSTPKTVDGMQDQIKREEEKYAELQKEIQALKVKLGYAEEVPEVDESQLFVEEPPPVDPIGEGPAEAEPKEQGDLGGPGGPDQEAAQPVSSPKSGEASPVADGPVASPAGSQGSGTPAELPTLARQSSNTGPPAAVPASPGGSPRALEGEESGSQSPRPADASFGLLNLSAPSSPASAMQDSPPFTGLDLDVPLEEEEQQQDTDATPEARGVPTGEFDPVPPLPLTPELPHEGEEDVSEPIDPPPAASASRRTLTIQIEPDVGTSAPQDAGEEASASMTELMKTQTKTEEMRDEIHDIDVKLKKLKALMKSKGGDQDAIVTSVREILGINHEEEVKAPAEFHLKKKELKEQQEKVRVLRKKWWDDHRDFDGLVEKVRNQMGGLHQLFTGPEGKLAQEFMQGGGSSEAAFQQAAAPDGKAGTRSMPTSRGRVRGSVAAMQGGKGGPGKGGRRVSGLIGFGAGVQALVDGSVQGASESTGPRHRFSMIKSATQSAGPTVGDETEAMRERRTLHSLFG